MNCPKFLTKKKGEGNVSFLNLHILELNYIDNSITFWIVNSGATNHVCASLQALKKTKEL